MSVKKKIIDHTKITLLFDIKNITRILLQNILAELHCGKGLILFYNKKNKTYNIIEYSGIPSKIMSEFVFYPGMFLDIGKNGIVSGDFNQCEIFRFFKEKWLGGLEKIAVFPINIGLDAEFGYLILLFEKETADYEEIKLVSQNHLTILKDNISQQLLFNIDDFDMIDSNTLLFNQDFLYGNLYKCILDSNRTKSVFTLGLLEIIDFSDHMQENIYKANALRKSFCDFLTENVRKIDTVGILYNSIMSIIFTDVDHNKTEMKLKELQIKINDKVFTDDEGGILPKITFTFGIASYPADGKTCELLLRNAIKSMK